MNLAICGIGTQRPANSLSQDSTADMAIPLCCTDEDQARWLGALYRRSGVNRRASVLLQNGNGSGVSNSFYPPANDESDRGPTTGQRMDQYTQQATPLAVDASHQALVQSSIDPAAITQLITVSCTGFATPGVDVALIKQLGLSPQVGRTHIGFMGCHAVLNAQRVALAMAKADPHAHILLCAVELCSLHFQYGWQRDQIVANALFADGAAALVGTPANTQPSNQSWQLQASGSSILPNTQDAMSWHIKDHGFVMTLSPRVPSLIHEHLRPWLIHWLATQSIELSQVRSWAVHPGGPRILDAVAQSLKLPDDSLDDSRHVLAQYGNMSSPTVLFILDRLITQAAPRPCVAIGLGPGLTIEAALFV